MNTRLSLPRSGVHHGRPWAVENWSLDAKWTPRGLRLQVWVGVVGCKSLNYFGGPGEIRTHDLFHAMVAKSITYEERRGKQKTCTTAIWTSFGPHALFHACLDLTFRQVLGHKPQRLDLVSSTSEAAALHVLSHARARSNPPCQFLVQDEERGALILRKAPTHSGAFSHPTPCITTTPLLRSESRMY